jgi:hypothetical protein
LHSIEAKLQLQIRHSTRRLRLQIADCSAFLILNPNPKLQTQCPVPRAPRCALQQGATYNPGLMRPGPPLSAVCGPLSSRAWATPWPPKHNTGGGDRLPEPRPSAGLALQSTAVLYPEPHSSAGPVCAL